MSDKPLEEMTFEEALHQLEQIVQRLEGGNLPLAEALALYEQGVQLVARCHTLLDEAELRIQQLVPDGEGGYTFEEFQGPLDSR